MAAVLDAHQRGEVMAALARIPALAADLDDTLAKQHRFSSPGAVGGVDRSRRLQLHLGASYAGTRLSDAIATYTGRVLVIGGDRAAVPSTTVGRARWLRARLPGVPGDHPSLEGLHPQVCGAVEAVAAVIERPDDRVYLGWCGECGTSLYAGEDEQVATCSRCGTSAAVTELRAALLDQARGRVFSARELARILPWFAGRAVSAAAIAKAGERGVLPRIVVSGRVLYRVGDVVDWQIRTAERGVTAPRRWAA